MSVVSPFNDTRYAGSPEVMQLSRQRAREQLQRDYQQSQLEAALQQQFDAADEYAETLRAAGLADVAERFEKGARRQAFNNARRGLLGGSIDIEQRAEQQAAAESDARNVAQQAELGAATQQARALQTRDNLLRQVLTSDPTQLQANLATIESIGDQSRANAQIGGINNQIQASRNQQQSVLGSAIGGGLSGAGRGISAALMGGA